MPEVHSGVEMPEPTANEGQPWQRAYYQKLPCGEELQPKTQIYDLKSADGLTLSSGL